MKTRRLVLGAMLMLSALLLGSCKDPQTKSYELKEACLKHLQEIQNAKQQLAAEKGLGKDDEIEWGDIIGEDKYIRSFPECPSGGAYALGTIGEPPTCSHKDEYYTHVYTPE